jgi:hypothetical protein
MSVNRLRQILQSNLVVRLDSYQRTLRRVQKRIAKRVQELAEKGEVPEIKTPSVVGALQQIANFNLRPVDLLRKIGQLTTPSSLNMAQFSASWATRRYFWAIQPRIVDAKYKMAVMPRSHGFLVTIPHSYQGQLPEGAKETVHVKAVGSAN